MSLFGFVLMDSVSSSRSWHLSFLEAPKIANLVVCVCVCAWSPDLQQCSNACHVFFELRFLSSRRPVTSTPILIAMDSDLFVNGGLASKMVGQRTTFADVCCIGFCKDRLAAVFVCLAGCCAVDCCALIRRTEQSHG